MKKKQPNLVTHKALKGKNGGGLQAPPPVERSEDRKYEQSYKRVD